ncbi:MAG: hypothetical protein JOY78_14765 [Pseudonocardia sp.]|nr:hypothetical protein [Pseudonocardia sp.]
MDERQAGLARSYLFERATRLLTDRIVLRLLAPSAPKARSPILHPCSTGAVPSCGS